MQHEILEVVVPSHYAELIDKFANLTHCTQSEVVVRSLELLFSTYFADAKERLTKDEFETLIRKLAKDVRSDWS